MLFGRRLVGSTMKMAGRIGSGVKTGARNVGRGASTIKSTAGTIYDSPVSGSAQALSSSARGGMRFGRGVGRLGARVGRRPARALANQALDTKMGQNIMAHSPMAAKRALYNKLAISPLKMLNGSRSSQARRAAGATKRQTDFFPRLSQMGSGKKKALGAAGLVAVGAASFASGVDSKNQVSNSVYDLAFNNPDYDKYVMGKKMGVRSLIAPMPGETMMRSLTGTTYSDAWRASRKNTPKVDGSIAFGMYNARLG